MLNKLVFKVEFSTGKTIKGHHNFEKGLSAITGRNESGKSLRLEMIRYALFGAKALRGASTTYKSIEAELDFTVNSIEYNIKRSGSKVFLKELETDDGEYGYAWHEVATGTKPVADAVRKIFGYDLEVFDIANACLQGEVEAMTNKKPAERKRMVDRTIGLDSIDKLIDKVSSEFTATRQAITLLNDKVIEVYEAPVIPSNYVESEKLQVHLQELQDSLNKKQFIEGKLSALKCEEPTKPQPYMVDVPLTELYKKQMELANFSSVEILPLKHNIKTYENIIARLNGRDSTVLTKYMKEGYKQKWEDYYNYEKQRVEKPVFTKTDLEILEHGFVRMQQVKDAHNTTCPNCSHNFQADMWGNAIAPFDVADFEQLAASLNIKVREDIRKKEWLIKNYEHFISLPIINKPDLDFVDDVPYKELTALENFEDFNYEEAVNKLALITHDYDCRMTCLSIDIKSRESQEKEHAWYNTKIEKYKQYTDYYNTVRDDLKTFEYVEAQIVTVRDDYMAARAYEKALLEYETKQEAQSQAINTLADLTSNLEELVKVKKSLQELKPKVKSHLLPSLNKVASTLLAQMTNNERTSIVVDEEFEILVDGQPVNTLSGSGKAVANLAVRIGLGSVLTNKIFSVFLADEIDASMDEERAAYTAQCLQNLTSVIDQIILVSHQQPEADHQIEV